MRKLVAMLNKCNFLIAKLCPEGDDAPRALTGILVSPTRTMATDGGVAIVVSAAKDEQGGLFDEAEGIEPADYWSEFILDKETALKVAKAIPKKKKGGEASQFAVVDATTEDNDRAMISINDFWCQDILRAKKIDGQFPKVEKLLKDKKRAKVTIHVDPHRLLLLAQRLEEFSRFHDVPSVEISWFGGGEVLRFDLIAEKQELSALLMPQRSEGSAGGGKDGLQ